MTKCRVHHSQNEPHLIRKLQTIVEKLQLRLNSGVLCRTVAIGSFSQGQSFFFPVAEAFTHDHTISIRFTASGSLEPGKDRACPASSGWRHSSSRNGQSVMGNQCRSARAADHLCGIARHCCGRQSSTGPEVSRPRPVSWYDPH